MTMLIAHLGPPGTYTEQAALAFVSWVHQQTRQEAILCPLPSIAQTLRAVAQGKADLAVVPVENSIEGSVSITLDMLWQQDKLQIQQALVIPITHALLSRAPTKERIQTVYSHPQALAQCQGWLEQFLPDVQLISTNSTTEALGQLEHDWSVGAISSLRASQLYNLPILASPINDHLNNSTRFWVLGQGVSTRCSDTSSLSRSHTTLAFSVPANVPGALVKPLEVFAQRGINLSRIESRPSKRSLGEYIFFIDLEGDTNSSLVQSALAELTAYTQIIKIFGSHKVLPFISQNIHHSTGSMIARTGT
ncbi:MAG: prephenate dehydratase [Stigonema ocellatum SAG 48.90 = DSM 106950]|nr:prephenate dehydratase [Stigonema ocellatum SAG 48.90 = DSM 106950]